MQIAARALELQTLETFVIIKTAFGDGGRCCRQAFTKSAHDEEAARMAGKTVAVIGASANRTKFGNKAVRAFRDAGWTVFPIHPTLAIVEGLAAYRDLDALPVAVLDQVSFYVPPRVGIALLEQVNRKHVQEVWLNPGSESTEILECAKALGLNVIRTCSILGIGLHPGLY
jgi:predicted CoA-binding protein